MSTRTCRLAILGPGLWAAIAIASVADAALSPNGVKYQGLLANGMRPQALTKNGTSINDARPGAAGAALSLNGMALHDATLILPGEPGR